jgi:hypothetical protein
MQINKNKKIQDLYCKTRSGYIIKNCAYYLEIGMYLPYTFSDDVTLYIKVAFALELLNL